MQIISKVLYRQILTMAVSVAIALCISFYLSKEQSFWLPLTTFCVSLYISTPVTALRRTVHRILGSIYGVLLAGSVILIWPNLYTSLFFLILFAGLTLWSRAFVSLYYLFVCFMTASVIMLLSILMAGTNLTPDYLITERLIFTLSGALISLFCSFIFMPPLESLDILKTYRHYLTRFILDYTAVFNEITNSSSRTNCTSPNSINTTHDNITSKKLLKELHASSVAYAEKMPIWKWQLFFNQFIYQSLAKYLHRIYNMRILTSLLHSSLKSFLVQELKSSQDLYNHQMVQKLLQKNFITTKHIIHKLEALKRVDATQALAELQKNNKELDQIVLLNNITELKTSIIIIHELENELEHLVSGPMQHYLYLQQNN